MNILYENVDTYLNYVNKESLVLIPVGCIENHGHLPLGTDTLIATRLAHDVMKNNPNTILTPCINYGCHSLPDSGGGFHMPGTICMDNIQFVKHLENVVDNYINEGCEKFMILNCHFENTPCILDTITRLYKKYSDDKYFSKNIKILNVCYWDLSSKEVLDEVFPDGFDAKIEHAGVSETSIIMHLYPHLISNFDHIKVKESNQYKYNVFDFNELKKETCKHSVLATPMGSTAEKGKKLWNEYIIEITKIIKKHF